MQQWFDENTAGAVGGIMGAVLGGGFGGIVGGVGGTLAAMGKAKAFVIGMFITAIGISLIIVFVGLYALINGQPWHVWFAFLLPGMITSIIMGGLLPVVQKRYCQAEQRKLDAEAIRTA